jgi:putative membrane protein insertion efficiency factor
MTGGFAQTLGLKALKVYKSVVSPWLPPACRFTPTCSEYASEAIQEYGLLRGTGRALSRLLRCHPLHRGGFDPLK